MKTYAEQKEALKREWKETKQALKDIFKNFKNNEAEKKAIDDSGRVDGIKWVGKERIFVNPRRAGKATLFNEAMSNLVKTEKHTSFCEGFIVGLFFGSLIAWGLMGLMVWIKG